MATNIFKFNGNIYPNHDMEISISINGTPMAAGFEYHSRSGQIILAVMPDFISDQKMILDAVQQYIAHVNTNR